MNERDRNVRAQDAHPEVSVYDHARVIFYDSYHGCHEEINPALSCHDRLQIFEHMVRPAIDVVRALDRASRNEIVEAHPQRTGTATGRPDDQSYCWNCGLLNTDDLKDCQHCEAPLPSLVFNEVLAERNRQDAKWGGPEHDDQHGAEDWNRFITRYSQWAAQMADMNSPDKYRRRMVQVAAIAIAAVESLDRQRSLNAPETA